MFISDGVYVELVKVTELDGGYFSVVRAQDGTTARAFPIDSRMYFEMSGAAVTDMVNAAIAELSLPDLLTFVINSPHTVERQGTDVVFDIQKLPLVSPNSTIDITTVGDGYGLDIERGAFGCCPAE
jgi:hypothetical protein